MSSPAQSTSRSLPALAAAGLVVAALAGEPAAATTRVERVVSPGGIEAWLVRETQTPMIAVEFAIRGGNAQDPAAKPGVANFLAAVLDESGGDFESRAFQQRIQQLVMSLSFSASRDAFYGSIRTLSANRDAAFDMLRLALTRPRFDAPDIERIRAAILAGLRREQTQPGTLAARAFSEVAFPSHPYGRPPNGTLESVASIGREDLVAYHRRILARDALFVTVVGDVDAATLGPLLDRTFGDLPARGERAVIAPIAPAGAGTRRIVEIDTPQTTIQFGVPGIPRRDPDFIAAFVMNHVLGGGSFTSRLWTEVRERRGLTYGISTGLSALDQAAFLTGSTSTRNDRAAQTLGIIEAELRRMANEGPTEAELERAKSFLIGSYLLRFDTSARIAQQLLSIQLDELGIDWIDRRNGEVAKVTIEDVRRVARRILDSELIVTMAGRPAGVSERRPGG
jgi:zinc protease